MALSAPDQASFDQSIPAIEKVVKSFRLLAADSGEFLACSEADGILGITAETHDQIVPPKGWKQGPGKPGVTIYQRIDGKAYGIIAAYAAKPGDGDAQADYEAAWRELAQTAFQAVTAPNPKPIILDQGWQIKTGETRVEKDGRSTTVILAVFLGFGKYTSIHICFNNGSFRAEIEDFQVSYVYPSGWLGSGFWTFKDSRSCQYVNGKLVNLSDQVDATRSYTFGKDTYVTASRSLSSRAKSTGGRPVYSWQPAL